METKEEQHIEIEKARVKRKDKYDKKVVDWFVFDQLDTSIGRNPLYL